MMNLFPKLPQFNLSTVLTMRLRNGIHRSRCNLPFLNDSSTQFCSSRFAPDFTLQLQLMELRESNVWNLYQAEAFTANLFSHMTEGELTNECGFNRPRIIRFRAFKDDLKRSQEISHRPVPPSVFATLPQFRGKGEKNIQDPTLFLNRFEQVMLSAGIPRDRWSKRTKVMLRVIVASLRALNSTTTPENAMLLEVNL